MVRTVKISSFYKILGLYEPNFKKICDSDLQLFDNDLANPPILHQHRLDLLQSIWVIKKINVMQSKSIYKV